MAVVYRWHLFIHSGGGPPPATCSLLCPTSFPTTLYFFVSIYIHDPVVSDDLTGVNLDACRTPKKALFFIVKKFSGSLSGWDRWAWLPKWEFCSSGKNWSIGIWVMWRVEFYHVAVYSGSGVWCYVYLEDPCTYSGLTHVQGGAWASSRPMYRGVSNGVPSTEGCVATEGSNRLATISLVIYMQNTQ